MLVVRLEDDWKKYAMDGSLAMATGSSYMFIVPNIIESDVTVTETTGTELSIDIEKGWSLLQRGYHRGVQAPKHLR